MDAAARKGCLSEQGSVSTCGNDARSKSFTAPDRRARCLERQHQQNRVRGSGAEQEGAPGARGEARHDSALPGERERTRSVPALRKVVSLVSACVGVRGLLDRPRDCRGTGERVAEAQSETGKRSARARASERRSVRGLRASPPRFPRERQRLHADPCRRSGQVIRRSRAAPRRLPPPCRRLGCAPNPRRLVSPRPAQSQAGSRRPEHAHARQLCDAPAAPLERYERSAAPALVS
jgi:hypothetical protein